MTYDAVGNLLEVTLPSGTNVGYVVDGRNRRIGRVVNGAVTHRWAYQGQLRPVAEFNAAGAVITRFVYGARAVAPEYMTRGSVTYRFVTDHLGSVRLVVNQTSGAVVQRLDYDPWGRVVNDTNPGFQPFGYAGGLYDPLTSLMRAGTRDYDPLIGRWLSKDAIKFKSQDANLYAYVLNDPINLVDPTGRDFLSASANFSAGFGDTLTSLFGITHLFGVPGLTEFARSEWDPVDKCSTSFAAGRWTSVAFGVVAGGAVALNGGAQSVFYTGYPEAFEAAAWAGTRLTDTVGGWALNAVGLGNTSVMTVASVIFAANARGVATVFIHGVEKATSTWIRWEQPVLQLLGTQIQRIIVP